MAGLGGALALAGAVGGIGDSMVEAAQQRREEALAALKRQWNIEDQNRSQKFAMDRMGTQNQYNIDAEGRQQGREAAKRDRYANVYESLFGSESGGNFNAANSEGYVGRSQFGQARIDDFTRAQGTGRITTDQLRSNPELQKEVERWHFSQINDFIDKNGLAKFEGQNIGGVPITRSGMIAMAHLGGNGGLKKYLESGGKYNPADSNGTSLSDYAKQHGGLSTDMAGVWELMSDSSVPAPVRERIGKEAGIIKREPVKFGGLQWVKGDDGTETAMMQRGDSQQYEPAMLPDGTPLTRRVDEKPLTRRVDEKPVEMSATGMSTIRRFLTAANNDEDPDPEQEILFQEQARKIMREERVGEQEAIKRTFGMADRKGREEKVPGTGFLGFGRETRTVNDGKYTGTFGAGLKDAVGNQASDEPMSADPPEAMTAPPAASRPAAPPAVQKPREGLPRIESFEQLQSAIRSGALKVGSPYIAPDGSTGYVQVKDVPRG